MVIPSGGVETDNETNPLDVRDGPRFDGPMGIDTFRLGYYLDDLPSERFCRLALRIGPGCAIEFSGELDSRDWTLAATTATEIVAEMQAHLRTAGFPGIPPHPAADGAHRELHVTFRSDEPGTRIKVPRFAVGAMPGYRELFFLLDSIITLVTSRRVNLVAEPRPGVASLGTLR